MKSIVFVITVIAVCFYSIGNGHPSLSPVDECLVPLSEYPFYVQRVDDIYKNSNLQNKEWVGFFQLKALDPSYLDCIICINWEVKAEGGAWAEIVNGKERVRIDADCGKWLKVRCKVKFNAIGGDITYTTEVLHVGSPPQTECDTLPTEPSNYNYGTDYTFCAL